VRNSDRAMHPGNYWDLGDPGSILIEDASFVLDLPAAVCGLAVSPERGQLARDVALPFGLYQDSSGGDHWQSTIHVNRLREVSATFRGYRMSAADAVTEGLRATPIVVADVGGAQVGVAVPGFWQNCPRAIDVAERTLSIGFFPGQYTDVHELQGGEQKTHECWLACGRDITVESLAWS